MPNSTFNSLFVSPQAINPTLGIPAPSVDANGDFGNFLKLAERSDNPSPDPSTNQFDDSAPTWSDLNSWLPNRSPSALQQSTEQPASYGAQPPSPQNQSSDDTLWRSRSTVDSEKKLPASTQEDSQSRSDSVQPQSKDINDRRDQNADDPLSQSAASNSNSNQSQTTKPPTQKNSPASSDETPETQDGDQNGSQTIEAAGEKTEAVTATIVAAAKNTAATVDSKPIAQSAANKSPRPKADQTANSADQTIALDQASSENGPIATDPATAVAAKVAQAQIVQSPTKATVENKGEIKKSAVKAENKPAARSEESSDATNELSPQCNTSQSDQPQLQPASAQQSAVEAITSKSTAAIGKAKRSTSSTTGALNSAQQPVNISNNTAALAIADQTAAIAIARVNSTTDEQQTDLTNSNLSTSQSAQANLPASLTGHVSPAANNPAATNAPARIDLSAAESKFVVTTPRSAATAVDQGRFIQRVTNAFKSIDEQGGQMRLRLSPPELGSLKVEVSVRNGVMTARLETENNTTRSLLLDNLPALRERLAGQNIKIHTFDVDLKQDGTGNGSANPSPDFSGARQGSSRSPNNSRSTIVGS
ncbi:MAG TPA: flagellar hook-length control protein FliK, partial [Pirellulales bacterium]